MPWHPPIPAEAVYRPEVAALGAGLRLLFYFYNCIERDGTFNLSLTQAAESLEVEYETLRKWWQAIRKTEIVTIIKDKGHNGFRLKMSHEWIDWHVHNNNFSIHAQRENNTVEEPLNGAQPVLNSSSTVLQRENNTVENNVYGTHDSQESESHESPSPTTPRANRTPDRGVVVMLYDKGFTSSSAINAIARLGIDCETIATSIDNLRADGWKDNGRIMRRLQEHPPEPGQPYPRARAPAHTVTVDVPPPPDRPSKPVLSAAERRALLEQHRNGS